MPRKLKDSWLEAYQKYTEESESPPQYNLWCGISAISSALKKRVFIQRGHYTIYPNQYIVLVGPPGVGKGTAINPATQICKDAGLVNYISDRITAEKIIIKLAAGFSQIQAGPGGGNVVSIQDNTATIISTELPILLQASEWMLPLLCEIWEKGEFSYDTKTKGTANADGLCLGLVAGCVPDYISKLNKDATAAVTGGFTSRCIFVWAGEKGKFVPWPLVTDIQMKGMKDDLIEDLRSIAQIHGAFNFTPDGRKLWESYYNDFKPDAMDSDIIVNFKARMPSHVIKTAMALALSQGDKLELNKSNLFNSMKLIESIKKQLDVTFRSVGESALAVAQDRVLKFIELKGIATRSEILKHNYRNITDEDLTRVLVVLQAAGFITEGRTGNSLIYTHTGKARAKTTGGNP